MSDKEISVVLEGADGAILKVAVPADMVSRSAVIISDARYYTFTRILLSLKGAMMVFSERNVYNIDNGFSTAAMLDSIRSAHTAFAGIAKFSNEADTIRTANREMEALEKWI